MPKNDFESTNFANFEEVGYNFGRSDYDMIQLKNTYLINNQRMFNLETDNLAMKPYIPHKSLLQ